MSKANCDSTNEGACEKLVSFTRPTQAVQSQLLTRKEAAQYLGVLPETLAVWHSTKRYPLPIVKIGRLAKYRKSDLDAFIELRTVGNQGA